MASFAPTGLVGAGRRSFDFFGAALVARSCHGKSFPPPSLAWSPCLVCVFQTQGGCTLVALKFFLSRALALSFFRYLSRVLSSRARTRALSRSLCHGLVCVFRHEGAVLESRENQHNEKMRTTRVWRGRFSFFFVETRSKGMCVRLVNVIVICIESGFEVAHRSLLWGGYD